MRARVGIAVWLVAIGFATVATAAAARVVPAELRDVAGATIDVGALAARERLVFVTIKAAGCPVCRTQLQRLGRLLPHFRAITRRRRPHDDDPHR